MKPFEWLIVIAVALYGQALAVALVHQIDSERTHFPLRSNVVARGLEALHDFAFERGLAALFFFIEGAHQAAGILSMFDEQAAKVLGLQVVIHVE